MRYHLHGVYYSEQIRQQWQSLKESRLLPIALNSPTVSSYTAIEANKSMNLLHSGVWRSKPAKALKSLDAMWSWVLMDDRAPLQVRMREMIDIWAESLIRLQTW